MTSSHFQGGGGQVKHPSQIWSSSCPWEVIFSGRRLGGGDSSISEDMTTKIYLSWYNIVPPSCFTRCVRGHNYNRKSNSKFNSNLILSPELSRVYKDPIDNHIVWLWLDTAKWLWFHYLNGSVKLWFRGPGHRW